MARSSLLSERIKEWPGIDCAANRIVDAVVKMRRSIARVAGISNVAEYVAGVHGISGLEAAVSIEVRIVVHLPSRSENVDDLPSELVGSNPDDDAFGCAQDRCATRGEDINALV